MKILFVVIIVMCNVLHVYVKGVIDGCYFDLIFF